MKAPNITTGKVSRPQKVVIYGPEGVGKTTLASQLPNPLFIDAEGGSDHIHVARVTPQTMAEIRETCEWLASGESGYGSAILDTIDWVCHRNDSELLAEKKKRSIAEFPFGEGYQLQESRCMELTQLFDKVIAAGLNVVLLAHSKVVKFEEPDKNGSYDRYELKLEAKKVTPIIKEWCDYLFFLNYETKVAEKSDGFGGKRAVGGQNRLIHTTRHAAYDAKRRIVLPDTLPLAYESIAPIFPKLQPKPAASTKAEAPVAQDTQTADFAAIVKKAGGDYAFAALLASRNMTTDDVNDEYRERVLANPGAFMRAVQNAATATA